MSELRDELLFEYDQLRKELLQRDAQAQQITISTIVFLGALYGLAFSTAITHDGARSVLFYATFAISFMAMWRLSERIRAIYRIASYLRVCVEPKLPGVNWETRSHQRNQVDRDNAPENLTHDTNLASRVKHRFRTFSRDLKFLGGQRLPLSLIGGAGIGLSLIYMLMAVSYWWEAAAWSIAILVTAGFVVVRWYVSYSEIHTSESNDERWKDVIAGENVCK